LPITRATDIALRVLMTLANDQHDHITVSQLADDICVPTRYTGKIVQRLASEGWIDTIRGRGGGIKVSAAGRLVTPVDVINLLGEGWPTIDCTKPLCPLLSRGCQLHDILADAETAFMTSLDSITMDQLG